MSYNDLDEKQQIFIDKYLDTMDVTSSAKDAGYNKVSAHKIGLELLAQPAIQEAIVERREALNKLALSIKFEKEDLIRVYWNMYNDCRSKGKLVEAKGILNDIAKWNGLSPDEVKTELAVLKFNIDGDKI